jgi:hypothetical protein
MGSRERSGDPMKRLLAVALAVGAAATIAAIASAPPDRARAQSGQDRLVVFETFGREE